MPPPAELKIDNEGLIRLFKRGRSIANTEWNRGLARLGGAFMRSFAKRRLSGGSGIKIRRRITSKARGLVKLPKKARAAGFTGEIRNVPRLPRKTLILRTSNPVMIAHEEGASISPRRARFLAVKIRSPQDALAAGLPSNFAKGRPIFTRNVKLSARLGFINEWRQFAGERGERVAKINEQIVKRMAR